MRIEPLAEKIVVRRVEAEPVNRGGIVLPDTAQKAPNEGRVVSVGPGRLSSSGDRIPMSVGEGDRVIFLSYSGTELEIDGEKLLILSESDVLAVLE